MKRKVLLLGFSIVLLCSCNSNKSDNVPSSDSVLEEVSNMEIENVDDIWETKEGIEKNIENTTWINITGTSDYERVHFENGEMYYYVTNSPSDREWTLQQHGKYVIEDKWENGEIVGCYVVCKYKNGNNWFIFEPSTGMMNYGYGLFASHLTQGDFNWEE